MRLANDKLRVLVTDDCNLDCFYCHNEGQAKGRKLMDPEFLRRVLGTLLADDVTIREVTVSGGEPLLHPHLIDLVESAASVVHEVTMVTNGTLLTRSTVEHLRDAGLAKIRLGIDSLNGTKPRPSRGYLDPPMSPVSVVRWVREAGLAMDLNVVVTRFNRHQLDAVIVFARDNGLSLKLFEHVSVSTAQVDDSPSAMVAKAHIEMEEVADRVRQALGGGVGPFIETSDFGEANLAIQAQGIEIRYCRYLCPFDLCWLTGTRVDANGNVFNCMSNVGLDNVSIDDDPSILLETIARASSRPCRDVLGG